MSNAGVCAIKEEYILKKNETVFDENKLGKRKLEDFNEIENNNKKLKDNLEQPYSRKNKGQNKARPKTYKEDKESKPCPSIVTIQSADKQNPCQFNDCKFIHNPLEYLKIKAADIGKECHLFKTRGFCPRGIACRYGSIHISPEGYNIIDEEKLKLWKEDTKNTLQHSVQTKLQKKQYVLSFAESVVKVINPKKLSDEKKTCDGYSKHSPSGIVNDEDIIKLLPKEKKRIHWRDKLYLSPLTTVGNLPFRRICKTFGADITCGEMALCESLLKGTKQEWALVKRHETEDIFGAQICGNNPFLITKVVQLLQETTELDFIDLNVGCPIDLIYKKGGGSGLMHRLPTLEGSVKCASKILNIPFTVKMRTGVYQNKKIAHTIIPKIADAGTSLITLHGRSREARYIKSADWEYIEECAQAAKPCPLFGNGDVLSYDDYVQRRNIAPSVEGVMIGRGALIKPWIFTEIKEKKIWDISSKERFDMLKTYTNNGLEHWGCDTQGVETTRRFLLEWLSFLYRYVPVGILERPPQKINERPPAYLGRDDLETLMASGNCSDWIKISEMLLGPTPDGFMFLPKHKANSYQ